MIDRWAVLCLGLTQLISWGITYYLVGAFGDLIIADTGWSREVVYGGFSIALLTMGLSSSLIGSLIDRHGGRRIMAMGAIVNAAGCLGLAASFDLPTYFASWVILGLGMRLTLYDAAFATLAHLLGRSARRPMSQITLLGGLASTVFWPVGTFLAEGYGWRTALVVYAGISLVSLPLLGPLPSSPGPGAKPPNTSGSPHVPVPRAGLAAVLYALVVMAANFLNSGMSAHMIAIMTGLGLATATAIAAASLRGIGQSAARLCEVMFGAKVHPLSLNLFATLVVAVSFAAGYLAVATWQAAALFALMYGAGNGLLTITRGTVPLVLFDPSAYGRLVGRLVAPSFLLSATAPVAYAATITHYGEVGALLLSGSVATIGVLAALALLFALDRSQNGEV